MVHHLASFTSHADETGIPALSHQLSVVGVMTVCVAGSIQASSILQIFEIIIKQGFHFGDKSFIVDVGSGTGEFSLACLAIPGLEKFFSIGVEFQQSAYQVHS